MTITGQEMVIEMISNWIMVRDQSWEFTGRTDVEAGTPILWPPDAKNRLIGKDPDAGKVEGGRRSG